MCSQSCSFVGLGCRAAFLISSVVRHLGTCCGFLQKARTSPALCIQVAGPAVVAGLGWAARRPHFAMHFSFLCRY
jgi:hypothetical protein